MPLMTDVTPAATTHAIHPPEHAAHPPPLGILVATLGALLLLTFITVGVTRVAWLDFGPAGNLWIALVIATVKGTLVVLYFMHVRYDKPVIGLILITTLVLALVFIGLTLTDSVQYQDTIEAWRAEDPTRYAPDLQQP
jgi:cytochrome c oxidase subunit 4